MRTRLLAVGMWAICGSVAHAEAGVVIFERDGLRPGLCGALRIQLSDTAEVRCEADASPDVLDQRLAQATARVRALGTKLGVLVERDADSAAVRMYIVGSADDQAVIAIERIADRREPDVDRSLALKVRAAYDVLTAAEATRAMHDSLPFAATLARRERSEPRPWALVMDAGGGIRAGTATAAFASVGLGVARLRPHFGLEIVGGVRVAQEARDAQVLGRVRSVERGPFASLRLLWRGSHVELGGTLEALLSALSAEGVASDGSRGSQTLWTPVLGIGADLRIRLFSTAFLRLGPTLALRTIERRLAIDQHVIADVGRLQAWLPLSLVVQLPLRRDSESLQP